MNVNRKLKDSNILEGLIGVNNWNLTDFFSYVVQDGWLLGAQASQPLPVQVIADVDMVKGKTTLIRIPVTFKSVLSNDTITPNVTVYWNGTFVGQNLTTSFSYNQSKNIDFWYVPTNAGTNLPIEVRVNGLSANGINYSDVNSKSIDVVFTRNLMLTFVSIDDLPINGLTSTIDKTTDFVQRTYPLPNNNISYEILGEMTSLVVPSVCSLSEASAELCITNVHLQLAANAYLSGHFPERIVGVVPQDWFGSNTAFEDVVGHARPPFRSVLIEEGYRSVLAHELGHTYSFCEEYGSPQWSSQNSYFKALNYLGLTSPGCQNGDISPLDNQLDSSCLDGSIGCDTSTIGKLIPWNGSENEINLFNFMGLVTDQNNRWISKDSYEHLLDEFSHTTPQFANSRIYISGLFNETSENYELNNFYTLEAGLAENLTDYTEGNFTIDLKNNANNSIYNLSFNVGTGFNENGTISNIAGFTFVMPFTSNVTKIIFKQNNIVKQTINVSLHIPNITINYPNGGEFFNNNLINISWNSSDADNDTLKYAVLLSKDNGLNYTTLTFDHNYTSFVIDSSSLPDCNACKIKILATDGVNTGTDNSDSSFGMDNNLNVTDLRVIYQNNTEIIFKLFVNNTLNQTLNNITWKLDTGENIISSQVDISLQTGEETYIFSYYNYTLSGSHTVVATIRKDIFIEVENISVLI